MLDRYFKVLRGRAKAKFMLAKKRSLDKKITEAYIALESCDLCEWKCRVNRNGGETGFCKVGNHPRIFSASTHWGEEQELTPSATLFFSGCTMKCCYCQNGPQSVNYESGEKWSLQSIARWIDKKHKEGCRNVNFVGGEPTPNVPFILKALSKVKSNMPVVFNSNGYYSEKTAQLLKDVMDVYLLDFRYFDSQCAEHLSKVRNYPEVLKRNLLLAEKDAELVIRLLVLPGHIECDAKPILEWISQNLVSYKLNILPQYWPAWRAFESPEIGRKLHISEFNEVAKYAHDLGIEI